MYVFLIHPPCLGLEVIDILHKLIMNKGSIKTLRDEGISSIQYANIPNMPQKWGPKSIIMIFLIERGNATQGWRNSNPMLDSIRGFNGAISIICTIDLIKI